MTRLLFAALLLAGCSCDGAPSLVPRTELEPEVDEPAPPLLALPAASRADLPPSGAMLTIVVRASTFEVSNRALVGSWPEAERVAVGQTRPVGDADYPVVEREVEDASDALVVPGLRDALADVVDVDRARATIMHAEGTASAFAIRADADVHFARVLAAVFAAGLAGFNQPHLALAAPTGERDLALVMPTVRDEDPALGARIASALAGVDAGPLPPPTRTHVALSETGIVLRRGGIRLAPGCADTAAADATEPTIAIASLTAGTIDACFAAAGGPGDVLFQAPGTMRYGEVVAVIETLAAHHSVSLAASPE